MITRRIRCVGVSDSYGGKYRVDLSILLLELKNEVCDTYCHHRLF